MIVSILECQDHGRLGIVKLTPPGIRPNGEWVYSGPWHAIFDDEAEMAGYGYPAVPCTSVSDCTSSINFYHMPP